MHEQIDERMGCMDGLKEEEEEREGCMEEWMID